MFVICKYWRKTMRTFVRFQRVSSKKKKVFNFKSFPFANPSQKTWKYSERARERGTILFLLSNSCFTWLFISEWKNNWRFCCFRFPLIATLSVFFACLVFQNWIMLLYRRISILLTRFSYSIFFYVYLCSWFLKRPRAPWSHRPCVSLRVCVWGGCKLTF